MQRHRPVPGIARGPQQQFTQSAHVPIQSPLGPLPQQEMTPAQAISGEMQDLALEIYARVIAQQIAADRTDREAMRTIAQHAQTAAKAYFESMGVTFPS